jgi:hypothetical protein
MNVLLWYAAQASDTTKSLFQKINVAGKSKIINLKS